MLNIFGALLGFMMVAAHLVMWGSSDIWYVVVALDVGLAVAMIWGGVAALRGKTNKILLYTALVLGALQIIQTASVLTFDYASPASTLLGFLMAVFIVRSLSTERSRAFFAARGGTTAERKPVLVTGIALGAVALTFAAIIAATGKPAAQQPRHRQVRHRAAATELIIDGHRRHVLGSPSPSAAGAGTGFRFAA